VLTIQTNGWTAAEGGFFSLDINKGTNALGFNTSTIQGSGLLDVTTNRLGFSKFYGETFWRVRQ
jgi:hypothetical protein